MSLLFDSNYPGADDERERHLDEEAIERVRRRNLLTRFLLNGNEREYLKQQVDYLQRLISNARSSSTFTHAKTLMSEAYERLRLLASRSAH